MPSLKDRRALAALRLRLAGVRRERDTLRARVAELEARCAELALLVDELRREPCGRCEAETATTEETTK